MSAKEIRQRKNQEQFSQWVMQVNQQQESGLNATAWCKLNNVKISTFFTRLKRIRESTLQNSKEVNCNTRIATASPFAEIDIANMRSASSEGFSYDISSNITVTLNGATIEIPSTAKVALVTSILCVVKGL